MPGRVDQVQAIGLAVLRLVVQGHAARLDGDAALPFQVHVVQDLVAHLAVAQCAAQLDEAVRQRRLAVVYMRDDGEISDILHRKRIRHGLGVFAVWGQRIRRDYIR